MKINDIINIQGLSIDMILLISIPAHLMLSLSRIVLEYHRDDKYPIIYGYLLYDDHIYGYYHVWIYGKIHKKMPNHMKIPNHIMIYGNMVIIVIPYL